MAADSSSKRSELLIWIDLEMTGLDPQKDRIIEIATVITDSDLEVVAEGPELAVHQPDSVLAEMDEWNQSHHGASGLVDRVRESACSVAEAEAQTLAFLTSQMPPGASPMCGNSICQDRRFLVRWMPQLAAFFHYRNLDVSTLKELCQRWAPAIPSFQKNSNHRALEDVRSSIAELRYYRERFIR